MRAQSLSRLLTRILERLTKQSVIHVVRSHRLIKRSAETQIPVSFDLDSLPS